MKASDLLAYSSTLNVLYVEDDELIAKATLSLIKRFFKEIDWRENGIEGLEAYTNNMERYDIVISDIRMPKMSGIDMCRKIKEMNEDQVVVITSASNDSDNLINLIEIGVDKFLLKPLGRDMIVNALYSVSKQISNGKSLELYRSRLEQINDYNTMEQLKAYKKQKAIINNDLLVSDEFHVETIYRASDILSGDSYSIYCREDGTLLVYLIDAMGHGILPSLTAFSVSSAVKKNLKLNIGLDALAKELLDTLASTLLEEEQLSCVFIEIDASRKKLRYFNAGMYSPFLRDGDAIRALAPNNMPIMSFDTELKIDEIALQELSSLLVYSDGIVESDCEDGHHDLSRFMSQKGFEELCNWMESITIKDDTTVIYIDKR